jgi:hypothetical protein
MRMKLGPGQGKQRLKKMVGRAEPKRVARCNKSVLAFIGALCLLAACAKAQVDEGCVEATTLWIPSNTSTEKVVVKWSKPLKYDIIVPQDEKPAIIGTIEGSLHFFAQKSGLKVEPAAAGDLVIAVAHDISAAAPNFRKYVEEFLSQASSEGRGKGSVEIDPAQWESKFRSISPKCGSVDIFRNGTILRGFGLIQSDESAACVDIIVAELLGLINIRTYYVDHDRRVPVDFIAAGIRALYDKRVKAGSSAVEADKIVEEVCKLR